MSTGTRPGGLTALGVLNYILGIGEVLSGFALINQSFWPEKAAEAASSEEDRQEIEAQQAALAEVGDGTLYALIVAGFVTGALLICSGWGYFKVKKLAGRRLGTAYAVLALLNLVGKSILLPQQLGGGSFTIGTIIGLIYPLLTLFLLNVTFKEDFVN